MLPKTYEELEQIKEECHSMVTKRATASGAATLIPIPGTDVAADIGMLLELMPAINRRFGLTQEQLEQLDPETKLLVYGIIKTVGSKLIGQVITKEIIIQILKSVSIRFTTKQIVKYIPFVGQGAAAALSFSAMKYVGNSHVDDCYNIAQKILDKKCD